MKREVSPIVIKNFTGGINKSLPSDLIAENEFQEAINVEYSVVGNKLKVRGGLSTPFLTFNEKILGVFYDYEVNYYLVFLVNKYIYKVDLVNPPLLIGSLIGLQKPVCCKFAGKVLIASGEQLQSYDYNILKTISNSPRCDIVFERFNRVVISKVGDDYIRYSGLGNEEDWEFSDLEDSAKYIEIGFQDGGDISAVCPLVADMIIFKSNGKVFQLSNEYPDWILLEIGRGADVDYRFAVAQVDGHAAYFDRYGLGAISTQQAYANFVFSRVGEKFNAIFDYVFHPTLWDLKRKRQLLMRWKDGGEVMAYHYDLESATLLKFPGNIIDFVETETSTIVAMDKSLYYWSDENENDNGIPINSRIVFKEYDAMNKFIVSLLDIDISSVSNGSLVCSLGKSNINIIWEGDKRYKRRMNFITKSITPSIVSSSPFTLNHIYIGVSNGAK